MVIRVSRLLMVTCSCLRQSEINHYVLKKYDFIQGWDIVYNKINNKNKTICQNTRFRMYNENCYKQTITLTNNTCTV